MVVVLVLVVVVVVGGGGVLKSGTSVLPIGRDN